MLRCFCSRVVTRSRVVGVCNIVRVAVLAPHDHLWRWVASCFMVDVRRWGSASLENVGAHHQWRSVVFLEGP